MSADPAERPRAEREPAILVPRVPCPHCGQPVERRQLVCLSCGERVGLKEEGSWAKEPVTGLVAALMAVIVIGAGLFGFAISELTSGDGDESPEAAPARASASGPPERTPEPAATEPAAPLPEKPATNPNRVPGWPAGLSAHTVVLVSSSDGAAARAVAREARGTGLEAGLIRSEPYDLGEGLYVVYSGRFDTEEGAQRQAAGLQERYPGAYVQLIQRSQ